MRTSAAQVPRSHHELLETDSLPTSTTHSALERPQQRDQRVIFTSALRQTLTSAQTTPCPTAAQASTGLLLCLLIASAFIGSSWCESLRTRQLERERQLSSHSTDFGTRFLWPSNMLVPTRSLAFQPPNAAQTDLLHGKPLGEEVTDNVLPEAEAWGGAHGDQGVRIEDLAAAPIGAVRGSSDSGAKGTMPSHEHGELPMCKVIDAPAWAQWAGLALGMISACFYLKSRVSQIIKNITRKNTEGLATSMFICAMVGNITGFGGIVLRTVTWRSVLWQMPWMIGMFGTVAMDALIAYQTVTFARAPRAPDVDDSDSLEASASERVVASSGECCVPLLGGADGTAGADGKEDPSSLHKRGPADRT